MEQKGPNFIVLHAPAVLAKPWAAVRGEFGVYRAGPDKADGLQLVDYVAWSAPGSVRGEKKRRAGPWPASRFAPLAEGFGVYDPSTRLMPGSSIGLFPGNADGVPDHLAVYDNDEATPGKPNGGPRPKARILCAGRRAQTASARAWERGTMAGVSLKNVAKSYDAVQVIRDLSLEIRNREFMVLVGPSGCGKSTALRMIAGLEEISGGTITIGDRVVNDLPPKDRDIAMVFQSYALYPHMTVRQNLEFGLKIRKMPHAEIDRLVNSTAQMLGIEHLLDRKPRELSGGQRQRVAVGRAIVRQPAVFLFDEPLSNLDAKLRVQMRAEIAKLQQRLQTTTIYVTHDQVEAMTMGQRVAVMKDGDLKQVGTPMELYDKPANVFVASFIGMPPMNLISATIRDSGAYLATARSALPVPGSLRAVTAGKDGAKVTVGIRPENIRGIGSQVAGETVTVASDVEIIEPLGNEVVVHGRVGDDLLVAKLDPHAAPRLGDVIELVVELEKLHLFDAGTEQRLDA